MKKSFLIGLLALLIFPKISQSANIYTPYIGVDGLYNKASVLSHHTEYGGINFNIGTFYNDYFGTEIFYQTVFPRHQNLNNNSYKTSYHSYGLDLYLYFPVVQNLKLAGSVGVASYSFNEKNTGFSSTSDEGYGYRFGAGLLYNLTNQISIRTMARFVNFDHISHIDHLAEYTLGLRYHFSKE